MTLTKTQKKLFQGTSYAFLFVIVLYGFTYYISQAGIGWYVVVPPFVAIFMSLITKRVVLSLFSSIFVAAFLFEKNNVLNLGSFISNGLFNTVNWYYSPLIDSFNIYLLLFVFSVLSMVSIAVASGGFNTLILKIRRVVKSRRTAKLSTAGMGFVIFFDDYANTMVVGSAMRPLTDAYQISREKLAFIVDSTAAPIAGLAFISTWIGFEAGLFDEIVKDLSLSMDGFSIVFSSLSTRFYCILMLIFVLINCFSDRDFGPMREAERLARSKNTIEQTINQTNSQTNNSGTPQSLSTPPARTALLPIFILILVIPLGLWIDTSVSGSVFSYQTWKEILIASANTTQIFATAGILSFTTAVFCSRIYNHTSFADILKSAIQGLKLSLLPIGILVSAWALKAATDALQVGAYLTPLITDNIPLFLFPIILFLLASFVSFSTGTSWGTMGTLIPITIPIAYTLGGDQLGLLFILSTSAILDGSIFGDHCSPLSDTTILSSTSSSCEHIAHVRTQLPYACTVALIAIILGYLPVALGISPLISIMGGILSIAIIHWLVKPLKSPLTTKEISGQFPNASP